MVDATWDEIAPPAFAGYGKSASQTDIHLEIEGSSVSMLVIVGEVDPGNSADVARETTLRWYKNAVLEVFPRIGHYPMIEAPALTVSAVENFLSS